MKSKIILTAFFLVVLSGSFGVQANYNTAQAACNYPSDLDSAGRRCGGRAASVIPGGRLGGDGRYQDSQGRQRVYGTNNDRYDERPSYGRTSDSFNDLNNSVDGNGLNFGR